MAETTNISTPTPGLKLDLHTLAGDANTHTFALNALTGDRSGNRYFLQNESSTVCSVSFPPNYQVVGFREIPELNRTIYFLTNTITGSNQIGEVINCNYRDVTDKIEKTFCKDCPEYKGTEQIPLEKRVEACYCQYRLIVANNCLNFSVYYPVDIEYKIANCKLQLYFTDYLNERRFIYFDLDVNDISAPLVLNESFKVCTSTDDCICPEGYTYDQSSNTCIKSTSVPIIPSGDRRLACAASNGAYTNFGVALYNTFNNNGTGVSTVYHGADLYWSNPLANSTNGVLNRVGVWACDGSGNPQSGSMLPLNEPIGFIFPVTVPTTKTYYVGIAGDNTIRIRVDCNTIVDMDPTAVGIQYGHGAADAFKYWHVYPVTLTAGRHIFELTGSNFGSVAGFGAEIYDNTAAEIIAATGGVGLNVIFTTQDMRGQFLQISSSFSGTCVDSTACIDIDDQGNLFCVTTQVADADCDECRPKTCTEELDCDKLNFHPNILHPCINFIDIVNGGNLKAGVYQILIAYADSFSNPISNYYPSTQTIPIFRDPITFETNYETSKAIKFEIDNLRADSIFGYYNIVIASTVDNFTEFILVGTFSTSQTSYTYTGFEKAPKRLTPADIFFKRPFYEKARGVTSANNYLFFTGVKEYETLNLQPVANSIKLQWQTVALKEKDYFDPRNTFYYRSHMRDEVYPYAVIFEFANGRESCALHIPGREAISFDLQTVTGNDVLTDLTCDTTTRNKRWQVYNTGTVVDGDYEYTENCQDIKCWEYGDFAYWESTETYPKIKEIWGNLCGQPIRHHKFPDSCVTHIHDGLNAANQYKDNNYIFPIGVKVDHQSVLTSIEQAVTNAYITQAQADSIVGYRIVRGNRVGNKSIDAKGLLFNNWKYTRDSVDYYYPNYPYNDLNDDNFLAPDDSTYDGSTTSNPNPSSYYGGHDRFTFHSPDTHFVNTGLGNILKVETNEYGQSEGYFTHSECQAKHKFPSTAARAIALGFGVAAALSATGEKECKVIEQIAPFNTSGTMPISDVHQAGYVLASGSGTVPPILTTPSTGNVSTTEVHNTNTYLTWQQDTGLPLPSAPSATESITTCRGQTFQLINSNVIVNSILGFGGAGLGIVIQKVILGILEAGKVLDTIKVLLPHKNYSIQYNSVGKYNNYTCVAEGNKRRKIEKSAYLDPIIQNVDEPSTAPGSFETIKLNNWERESSVYLKVNSATPLAAPTKIDSSRVTMDQAGLGFDDLDTNIYRDISSYYVSIKRDVLNQYGQLCNIEYLETTGCGFKLDQFYTGCQTTLFGGDTFINRFALKRKMPFFQHTMCGLPNDTDVKYSILGNVAYPNYYFNTEEPFFERMANLSISIANIGATLQAIVGTNQTRLDARTPKFFYQNGYAHMFNYGIPYFLVESDINVDLRHGQNNLEKDFYPHNTNLKTWLDEELVPIKNDNFYFYNRTYSKQNKETEVCVSCIKDISDLLCQNFGDNSLIYSEPSDTESKNDNWLVFKANNYWNFSPKLGTLVTADGIESNKVLVRLTKGTQIFNAYNTIQATGENIQVGTGGIFQSRPEDIATTDLGHAGTQHKDILHTEYGHIWADAKNGQVFNLGTGASSIDELTKQDVTNWFKENLPFRIKKDFPELELQDLDNNLNGLGLHYCYDKRFKRFLITKLDYKVLDPTVTYNKTTKKFNKLVDNQTIEISLKNSKYFCNRSWTLSYSFEWKNWTSYHSYRPEFYVENVDVFDSSFTRLGQQKLYTHNATNKSYQVFYGKLEPFIIEMQAKASIDNNYTDSFEYSLDAIRYHNEFDTFYNRLKTFNKGILYNERQCSGLLTFKVSDPDDLEQSINYPKRTQTGYEILTTNSENIWRINDFWDVVNKQTNNMPFFNYDCSNVNKQLNYKALNNDRDELDRAGLRQHMLRARLINDVESNYHFVVHFGKTTQTQSIR